LAKVPAVIESPKATITRCGGALPMAQAGAFAKKRLSARALTHRVFVDEVGFKSISKGRFIVKTYRKTASRL
jgi:hypothetical protein